MQANRNGRATSWPVVNLPRATFMATLLFGCLLLGSGLVPTRATADEAATDTAEAKPEKRDILDVLGYTVTGGAAPGYVEDRACATCHGEIWRTYQEVAMSKSMRRPRKAEAVEALGEVFEHAKSARRYSMRFDGEDMIFRREQVAPDGALINVVEQRVDWIVGSGNHSRVYFVHQDGGELFQLPLAWYAADASGAPARWGLAPGFDKPDPLGLVRRVRRECMFCHNAYPDVPAGSDLDPMPHTYPADMPEGIGCQRCHGPGAEHTRLAYSGTRDQDVLRAAIVNPGDLPAARRDDICFGCHLQPSVAMPAIRRFGRGVYSFRPGQDLADYQVQVDVDHEGETRDQRFEINHHPYRLRQSSCYIASHDAANTEPTTEGSMEALSCLTCHDPHRKVPKAEQAAHYRAACQSCHEVDACSRPEHAPGRASGHADQGDCVACHMPPRRPTDVVQTVMTDHRIVRRFDAEALLAAREEREPILTDIDFYWPDRAPAGDLGEIYRATAVLRMGVIASATDHIARKLEPFREGVAAGSSEQRQVEQNGAWRELGRASLLLGRYEHALDALAQALVVAPEDEQARMWQGLAHARMDDHETAIQILQEATQDGEASAETWFNLANLAFARGDLDDALVAAERAVTLRELFPTAWRLVGRIHARDGRPDSAIDAYRKALAIDPSLTSAYLELSRVLVIAGRPTEAQRYLRHGIAVAPHDDSLRAALEALPAVGSAPTR